MDGDGGVAVVGAVTGETDNARRGRQGGLTMSESTSERELHVYHRGPVDQWLAEAIADNGAATVEP